jgi:hypothetical protein
MNGFTVRLLVLCLFLGTFSWPSPNSNAVNLTDSEAPTVTSARLLNGSLGPAVGFLEITILDSRNEIILPTMGVSQINFATSSVQVAEACKSEGYRQIPGGVRYAVFPQSASVKQSNGTFSVSAILLIILNPSIAPLPTGCPEWRMGQGSMSEPIVFQDAAKNRNLVYVSATTAETYQFGDSTKNTQIKEINGAFSSALNSILDSKTPGQTLCFIPPIGEIAVSQFASGLKRVLEILESNADKAYAQEALKSFNQKYPDYVANANVYMNSMKAGFNIEELGKLPLCGNPVLYRYSLYPPAGNEQFQDDLKKVEREISMARSKAEAKPKSKGSTITCVKGKSTLKISGKTPRCPAGYKKK